LYLQNVLISKIPLKKPYFLLASWKPLTKSAGSGSVIQSTDPRIRNRLHLKMERIRNTVPGKREAPAFLICFPLAEKHMSGFRSESCQIRRECLCTGRYLPTVLVCRTAQNLSTKSGIVVCDIINTYLGKGCWVQH
jgi:hypothetical protein